MCGWAFWFKIFFLILHSCSAGNNFSIIMDKVISLTFMTIYSSKSWRASAFSRSQTLSSIFTLWMTDCYMTQVLVTKLVLNYCNVSTHTTHHNTPWIKWISYITILACLSLISSHTEAGVVSDTDASVFTRWFAGCFGVKDEWKSHPTGTVRPSHTDPSQTDKCSH